MRRFTFAFAAAGFLAATVSNANAQDISGGLAIKSQNIFDDGYVANEEPVLQGDLSVELTSLGLEGCSLELFHSAGLTQSIGNETDVGMECSRSIDEQTEVSFLASRYFLKGAPDMTELTTTISHGPATLSFTGYLWDGGLQDGFQTKLAYNIDVGKLTLTPYALYETGIENPTDIVLVGAELSYPMTKNFAFVAKGVLPITGQKAYVSGGLTFRF